MAQGKSENEKSRELFCQDLEHDGWNIMEVSAA